jgi:hypothetical protein
MMCELHTSQYMSSKVQLLFESLYFVIPDYLSMSDGEYHFQVHQNLGTKQQI